MINEVMPKMKKALQEEDNVFKDNLSKTKHKIFYEDEIPGLSSNVFTERTLQYIIFRELCKHFKIIPEDLAYSQSNKRIDLAIYKNHKKRDEVFSEIGIEIKKVIFTKEGFIQLKSMDMIVDDFIKLLESENKHKYLLLFGFGKANNIDLLNDDFFETSEIRYKKRIFKKYDVIFLNKRGFKTKVSRNKYIDFNIILCKIVKNN